MRWRTRASTSPSAALRGQGPRDRGAQRRGLPPRDQGPGRARLHVQPGPPRGLHLPQVPRDEQTEDAILFIGHHPAAILGTLSKQPFDSDEYEMMGALMGEPLEVVDGETVDIPVPAWADDRDRGLLDPAKEDRRRPVLRIHRVLRPGQGPGRADAGDRDHHAQGRDLPRPRPVAPRAQPGRGAHLRNRALQRGSPSSSPRSPACICRHPATAPSPPISRSASGCRAKASRPAWRRWPAIPTSRSPSWSTTRSTSTTTPTCCGRSPPTSRPTAT